MSVQERGYMKRDEEALPLSVGVDAKNQAEADRILKWACTTQDSDGKWHRVTLALSRVPVMELYNVISNANFIAQRLREMAADLVGHPIQQRIEQEAANVENLRNLLRQRDRVGGTPIVLDPTLHIHRPRQPESHAQEDTCPQSTKE